MELNILLRGQSNAYYFDQLGGSATLKYALEYYLGFDGVSNKVNLIGASTPDAQGNQTIFGSTSLLPNYPSAVHWLNTDTTSGSCATRRDNLRIPCSSISRHW